MRSCSHPLPSVVRPFPHGRAQQGWRGGNRKGMEDARTPMPQNVTLGPGVRLDVRFL